MVVFGLAASRPRIDLGRYGKTKNINSIGEFYCTPACHKQFKGRKKNDRKKLFAVFEFGLQEIAPSTEETTLNSYPSSIKNSRKAFEKSFNPCEIERFGDSVAKLIACARP